MIKVTLDDITYNLPQTWDELDITQQRIAVTQILPLVNKIFVIPPNEKEPQPITDDVLKQLHIRTLQLLLKMKDEFFGLPSDHIHHLIYVEKATSFIFKDIGPLNMLDRRHKRLLGPGNKLEGVTIAEILTMAQFYQAFKAGNEKMLWPFLAIIFRPVGRKGKVPFSIHNVHTREKTVKKMPIAQQLLTIKWFEANLARLYDSNPDLPTSSDGSGGNHIELLLQIAKDGPFGNFEQVSSSPADIVFIELNRVAKEMKSLEKK